MSEAEVHRAPLARGNSPAAVTAAAIRNVALNPIWSTSTPPVSGPTKLPNLRMPPIMEFARPRPRAGTDRVMVVSDASRIAVAAAPTASCNVVRATGLLLVAVRPIATAASTSEIAMVLPSPKRAIAPPLGMAPANDPKPAAASTTEVAVKDNPTSSRYRGSATSKMPRPKATAVHGA